MRREIAVGALAPVFVCVAACGFSSKTPDVDVPPGVTVEFAKTATLLDETVGSSMGITVKLSAASADPVVVTYAFGGGDALPNVDYVADGGEITIAANAMEGSVPIAIKTDMLAELNEKFDVTLVQATNAELGTLTSHEITINADPLARVSFDGPSSSAVEDAAANTVIDVMLSSRSSSVIMVDYAITGTASSGVDFDLGGGTLVFPADTNMQQLVLDELDDDLDEDPETVVITLSNPTNALLGNDPQRTHTITDDDPLPTVSFMGAATPVTEDNTMVTLTVVLNTASGRTVGVDFMADGMSSANATSDYNFGTVGPLSFAAGVTSRTITVDIVEDAIIEPNEFVDVDLVNANNAMISGTVTHRVTINDDDTPPCFGTGNYRVCPSTFPMGTVDLPASIDTMTSMLCASTQPTGWMAQGQPQACFIIAANINVPATTTVFGARPLVLVASDSIDVSGTIDAASHRGGNIGPASPSGACAGFTANPDANTSGAGGGAGATFMSKGGDGGAGDNGNTSSLPGTSPNPGPFPAVLRAGCDAQRGGSGAGNPPNSGQAGRGGGVIYLVAADTIAVGGVINVSGSGANAGGNFSGGSGGGSGGMIKLHATTINLGGGALMANGGGGSSGGDNNAGGAVGNDPSTAMPTMRAAGGNGPGGNGGGGFAGNNAAVTGSQGGSNEGGGGGGGGGGYIESNVTLNGGAVSAGLIRDPT